MLLAKLSVTALVAAGIAPLCPQEAPKVEIPNGVFSFKGNYLGEPLPVFKAANATDFTFVNTGKPNWRGAQDKSKTEQVPTPLCTDEMRGFPGDPGGDLAPGEIACNVSPGRANLDGLYVANIRVSDMVYRFYNGKLYRIEFLFPATAYKTIGEAFLSRYGKPMVANAQDRSVFATGWQDRNIFWKVGEQAIVLLDGTNTKPAAAMFLYHANMPPAPKPVQDF